MAEAVSPSEEERQASDERYAPSPEARLRRRRRLRLKRLVPQTLLARSLLIIILPLVILQGISTWAFYDRHYENITRRLSQAVAGEIAAVSAVLEAEEMPVTRDQIIGLARDHLSISIGLLPPGSIEEYEPPFWPSLIHDRLGRALREQLWHEFSIDTHSYSDHVEVRVDLEDRGVLRVMVDRSRLFSSTIYIFLWWMFGSSLVLSAIATIFMRNQVRPIRRLAKAADAFGRGQDVGDFRPAGASEVRRAGRAFLVMRDRLRRQVQQRTEMLAGVSHDLRTPLTRMKLELAMLPPSPEIDSLQADITQMERMVEGYLAFARGEGSELAREIDVAELLRDCVAEARRAGAGVDLHLESALVSVVRPEALHRALANLLANAARYGERVGVTAHRRNKGIEILIDDDGPGIPEEQREAVFRPFVRLERSRNFDTGGTGLGLTIARDMIRGQGGELSLNDAPGGGLRARLWIPA
ncbi:ATP-binding protein [Aquibaculum arenosum]|uniref:histidine kinase n=1 Tax=Aquibaculum arenosum TaxID=3032591 RepID=A0ABT5YLV5_9PROT|nr:ATP-binding protein [Fodinicurvata sp. CAU 1616]MDF2095915.1 ATP-binding protein [Fodinicurvata sp. CAU 1616]